MPTLSILICTSENGIIGDKGRMLWDRKRGDYMRFSGLTPNHTLIMGRKSYEDMKTRIIEKGWSVAGEMGKERKGIVITKQENYQVAPDSITVHSIEELVNKIKKIDEEVFVTGGETIYKEMLPRCNRIYLTVLHTIAEGDASFIIPNREEWKTVYEEKFPADEKNEFDYTFYTLERINPVEL
jgi:dihydrofolate reductase